MMVLFYRTDGNKESRIILTCDLMQDVCSSSITVALELYCATGDAILLYEAIIPVRVDDMTSITCDVAVYILEYDLVSAL